jgi:hypothetical protein
MTTTTEMTVRETGLEAAAVQRHYDELAGWDAPRLAAEFRQVMAKTAANVARMAAIVRRIEEHDPEQLDTLGFPSWVRLLRRVAYGQVLPEVVANTTGRLRHVAASLPGPEQKRIAADEPLRVVELAADGPTYRQLRPSQLDDRQIQQVFARDGVRSEAEQVTYLRERAEREPKREKPPVLVNTRRRCLVITRPTEIAANELTRYLEQLMGR